MSVKDRQLRADHHREHRRGPVQGTTFSPTGSPIRECWRVATPASIRSSTTGARQASGGGPPPQIPRRPGQPLGGCGASLPSLSRLLARARHAPGDRWFVDETYVKVAGRWTYLYRAIDQHGQVIDVLLSARRDLGAARGFFTRALRAGTIPVKATTDRAPVYPRILDEVVPHTLHTVEQYADNPIEADHGRLKSRLRPMRGLKRHRSAQTVAAGHAFVQNLRRDHYEIATDQSARDRLRVAFAALAGAV
jgi:IS6 family transposase